MDRGSILALLKMAVLTNEIQGRTLPQELADKVDAVASGDTSIDLLELMDQINDAMKAASTESFGYNTDEIVSSDIVGSTYGSIFDATQTMVAPMEDGNTQVQVVSWYDNENSYTSQMVRTIKYFSELK